MSESTSANPPPEESASIWQHFQDEYDYVRLQRGDVRDGLVVSVRPNEVILDIGAKQDAIVSSWDLEMMSPEEIASIRVGVQVKAYVLRVDDRLSNIVVSLRLAKEYEDWEIAQQLAESGEIVHVTTTGYNKGGLLCNFRGIQGFVPASQISQLSRYHGGSAATDSLSGMVGQEMVAKVIEVNRRRRRLILSERAASHAWRAQQREQLLAEIEAGQVRTGIVSNLVDFGAFVDLGGVEGLLHISELSWERVEQPRDLLAPGDEVQVCVLNVDMERQRIGLSIKRLLPDPWEAVASKVAPGDIVRGAVTHTVRFGAFVEIEPGVEGLVHISELAEGGLAEPSDVVRVGQELTLLVLQVDSQRHRLSLSPRQVVYEAVEEHQTAEHSVDADSADEVE